MILFEILLAVISLDCMSFETSSYYMLFIFGRWGHGDCKGSEGTNLTVYSKTNIMNFFFSLCYMLKTVTIDTISNDVLLYMRTTLKLI